MTGGVLPPDEWFGGLPGVVIAGGALFTDPDGRVLLVKPNYRDHWTIPGGVCEYGEPPHVGAAREIAEEIGLAGPAGPLLTVDWSQPYGRHQRPIMHFVFDGGTIPADTPIKVQAEELDAYRFTATAELASYVPPYLQARITAALAGGPVARPSTSRPGPGSGRRGQAGRADPVSSSAAAARHRR